MDLVETGLPGDLVVDEGGEILEVRDVADGVIGRLKVIVDILLVGLADFALVESEDGRLVD